MNNSNIEATKILLLQQHPIFKSARINYVTPAEAAISLSKQGSVRKLMARHENGFGTPISGELMALADYHMGTRY